MIGKIITHYKIINKLGEGGMGILYLAEDININRKAVLKFLPPEMLQMILKLIPDLREKHKLLVH